jgi:hypothetical protein
MCAGWGAVSLLMRHADVFSKAASFDAPLLPFLPDATLPGMCDTFFTNLHYQPYYQILDLAEDDHVAAQLGSAQAVKALGAGAPPGATAEAAAAAEESPRVGLFAGCDEANAEDADFLSRVLLAQGVPHVFDALPEAAEAPLGWSTAAAWLPPMLAFLSEGAGRCGADAYEDAMTALAIEFAQEELAEAAAAAAAAESAAAAAAAAAGVPGAAGATAAGGDLSDEFSDDDVFDVTEEVAGGAAEGVWAADESDADVDVGADTEGDVSGEEDDDDAAVAGLRELAEEGGEEDAGMLR